MVFRNIFIQINDKSQIIIEEMFLKVLILMRHVVKGVHHWYFLDRELRSQSPACIGCTDALTNLFNNIVISNILGVDIVLLTLKLAKTKP